MFRLIDFTTSASSFILIARGLLNRLSAAFRLWVLGLPFKSACSIGEGDISSEGDIS